jgi:hypothetical protein
MGRWKVVALRRASTGGVGIVVWLEALIHGGAAAYQRRVPLNKAIPPNSIRRAHL